MPIRASPQHGKEGLGSGARTCMVALDPLKGVDGEAEVLEGRAQESLVHVRLQLRARARATQACNNIYGVTVTPPS